MIRIEPVLLSVMAIAVVLGGCSSKPSSDTAASPVSSAPAKPQFDFGTPELSPASGSGMEATFRITLKSGSQKPLLIGLLINAAQNGGNACYAYRNLAANSNFLVADSGSGSLQLLEKSVANRQCELLRDGTGATSDESGTTATYHVRFRPGFQGAKHVWVMPGDAKGNGPALQQVGEWTVQ